MRDHYNFAFQLNGINASIETISDMVDGLFEESLHSWKAKYKEAVENATVLGPVAT